VKEESTRIGLSKSELLGANLLHAKDSQLQQCVFVSHAVEQTAASGGQKALQPSEKIGIWMKTLEKTHLSHRDDSKVMWRIKESYKKNFVIKPENVPESYFENQGRMLLEEGYGHVYIRPEMRDEMVRIIQKDQEVSLYRWIDYFTSPDSDVYPTWAKYWAFMGMANLSSYDKEKQKFGKRNDTTVAPYPDLNYEALALAIDLVIKKAYRENIPADENDNKFKTMLGNANFGEFYAYFLQKLQENHVEGGEFENTRGKWVKYAQGSDHLPLVKSLEGYNTGWCTAGELTAEIQLQTGDFYVYYSYDREGKPKVPRVAIRMDGYNQIAEIRGVAKHQNLDPYIGDVVSEKLEEFPDKDMYLKKTQDMKRLTAIEKQVNRGDELSIDDLRFLYQTNGPITGFGHEEDPRIGEIQQRRNKRKDLALIFNCSESEISLTQEEALSKSNKFYYGNIELFGFNNAPDKVWQTEQIIGNFRATGIQISEGTILPKIIQGDLILNRQTSAKGITFPQEIEGSIQLDKLTSAERLMLPSSIGGSLDLSALESAQGLVLPDKIGGNLCLSSLTSAEGLVLPSSIGGGIVFGRLKSAKGLVLPDKIGGGGIYFSSLTSAEGLTLPRRIDGSLDLGALESTQGLVLPDKIGVNLCLSSLTSAEGLVLPRSIGGNLDLGALESTQGLVLPDKMGGLCLSSLTSADGLKLPRQMSGSLSLGSLTSAEELVLPRRIGGELNLGNLKYGKGLIMPRRIGGDLNLSALKYSEGLKLPGQVAGSLSLGSLTSAEGLMLPRSIGGSLDLSALESAQGLVLPDKIGGDLYLSSLTSAEGLILPQQVEGNIDLCNLTSIEGLVLPQKAKKIIYYCE
jgi:hypothetical protein